VTSDDKRNGELLQRVQALDLTIDDLRERAGRIPAQIQAWRDTIQAHEIQKAMFQRQREDLLLKQRHFEAEIAAKQVIRGKYNQQLTLIKTNREYRALLEELDGVNTEIRGIEDIVLNAMNDIEAVDAEIDHQKAAIDAEHTKIAENEARLREELSALEQEIAEVQGERDSLATDIDTVLLNRYERVRSRRGGAALAQLDADHGACGGCHMGLRPQDVNAILGGTLVQCENCGRLLIYNEQEAESTTA